MRVLQRLVYLLLLPLTLYWTNPTTNADGSPCTDLAGVIFLVRQAATGNAYEVRLSFLDEDGLPYAAEGDSLRMEFSLPPGRAPYDWWRITVFSFDFSDNKGDSSNTISVNASDYSH